MISCLSDVISQTTWSDPAGHTSKTNLDNKKILIKYEKVGQVMCAGAWGGGATKMTRPGRQQFGMEPVRGTTFSYMLRQNTARQLTRLLLLYHYSSRPKWLLYQRGMWFRGLVVAHMSQQHGARISRENDRIHLRMIQYVVWWVRKTSI
jgi:hypothetical protein